ncbi:MAG TPA: hypothetical protein VFC63_12165 [Blastocatellia bacterium]|nr:hypothetical protein [Blastocatellia bacterium]
MDKNKQRNAFVDLYPDLTPEQQQEAAYYFSRYVDLVRRIFERNSHRLTDLTGSRKRP